MTQSFFQQTVSGGRKLLQGGGEGTRVRAQVVFPQGQVSDPQGQARRLQSALQREPQTVFAGAPQLRGRPVRTERAESPFQTQARSTRISVPVCSVCIA